MDKTKCNKHGCEGIRFKGRLCEEHFKRYKEGRVAFGKSLKRVLPKMYSNVAHYTKISK